MRILRTALLFCLMSVPVWGQKVEFDHDPQVDFKTYHTYSWHPNTVQPMSFPVMDSATLDGLVREAVEKRLAGKGFKKVDSQPDFLVSYTVTGKLTADLRQVDSGAGIQGLPDGRWRPFYNGNVDVKPRKEGTLTLNIHDTKEMRVVWQALGTDVVKNAKDIEKKIDRGVKKMIDRFPPKG